MPYRCFVPNCNAGYPGFKPCSKVVLFTPPKDEALFKEWELNILRKDANLKASSRVCSGHFEEDDIIKGRLHKGNDGQDIFYAWNNWSLKEGAIPGIFPGCPSYLNKPKSAKRKLPKGKQTANKRNRTECDQLVELREHKDDFSENWEGVPVDDSSLNDPWLSFKPEDCPVPPGWFWIQSSDVPEVSICVKFQLIPGKAVQSKSVHLKGKSVFWTCDSNFLNSTELNPEDTIETLVQQMTRIVKDFDEALICKGVREEKLSNIKFCAGAVLQNDTWRSIHCQPVFSATNSSSPSEVLKGVIKNIEMGTPTCYECYTIRRALVRLASKPATVSDKEKLAKLRSDYQLAKQKIGRKEEILNNMEKEIAAMEAREHILMLEKRQIAAELIVKQGIIDLQAAELLKVRTEFAEQASKVKEIEEKFRNVFDSLNPKVCCFGDSPNYDYIVDMV